MERWRMTKDKIKKMGMLPDLHTPITNPHSTLIASTEEESEAIKCVL